MAIDTIVKQFPDPDADPVRFHSMVNALITSLNQWKLDGDAALSAYQAKTPERYLEYLKAKGANSRGWCVELSSRRASMSQTGR